jgi:hypothetical protein
LRKVFRQNVFLEKREKKSEREKNKRRLSIFFNYQVRVRLTFNIIKGMILKNEFSMIRLRFCKIMRIRV